MERRTLVRLLIGLASGIPVLVEVVTFPGLPETRLFDGDGNGPDGTPTRVRVGVGDEVHATTPPSETVTNAVIRGRDSPWLFVLTTEVENSMTVPYELQLGTLALGSGESVPGGASTGRVPAGDTGEVTGVWELPEGSTPTTLTITGIAYGADAPAETVAEVPLAKVPVRGG